MTEPKHGQSDPKPGNGPGDEVRHLLPEWPSECEPQRVPDAVSPDPRQGEVYGLAEALLGNVITAEESQRLNELLSKDAAARRRYVRFMYQTVLLRSWSSAPSETGTGERARGEEGETNRSWSAAISPPLPLSPSPLLVAPAFLAVCWRPTRSLWWSWAPASSAPGHGRRVGDREPPR